jgi:hypothetical protein
MEKENSLLEHRNNKYCGAICSSGPASVADNLRDIEGEFKL